SQDIDLPVHRELKVRAVVICRVNGFRVGVVDDSRGVVIRPLLPSVHSCREDRIVLGLPFDLLDCRLARCGDGEPILDVLVAVPPTRGAAPATGARRWSRPTSPSP